MEACEEGDLTSMFPRVAAQGSCHMGGCGRERRRALSPGLASGGGAGVKAVPQAGSGWSACLAGSSKVYGPSSTSPGDSLRTSLPDDPHDSWPKCPSPPCFIPKSGENGSPIPV